MPEAFVKADIAAVQVIGAVVGGEVVALAVEAELACRDAVAVSADERAEVGRRADVRLGILVVKIDVGEFAIAIGHVDRGDDAAQVEDVDAHTVGIGQRVLRDLAAIVERAELGGINALHDGHCKRTMHWRRFRRR